MCLECRYKMSLFLLLGVLNLLFLSTISNLYGCLRKTKWPCFLDKLMENEGYENENVGFFFLSLTDEV